MNFKLIYSILFGLLNPTIGGGFRDVGRDSINAVMGCEIWNK